MMYPYLTMEDGTEIVHSEMQSNGTVKVYMEKPDAVHGFLNATCFLPAFTWTNDGFSDEKLSELKAFVQRNAALIMQFSKEGGMISA